MKQFKREYYLVGGTAIALHIGHRRSVDFDMFKETAINHKKNLEKISAEGFTHQVTRRDIDYTEAVEFFVPDPPSDDTIKSELTRISVASI